MRVIDTGMVSYRESYELQLRCRDSVIEGEADCVVVTEMPLTITKGMRGTTKDIYVDEKTLRDREIEVVDIRRGGLVTLHGPGQVVIYPIINLKRLGKGIKWYIETLQDVVIETLQDIGIKSYKKEGIVGIFTNSGKICAMGIEVKKWTTLHGIAINNTIELDHFKMINPCGVEEFGVSSIKEKNIEISSKEIAKIFLEKLGERISK